VVYSLLFTFFSRTVFLFQNLLNQHCFGFDSVFCKSIIFNQSLFLVLFILFFILFFLSYVLITIFSCYNYFILEIGRFRKSIWFNTIDRLNNDLKFGFSLRHFSAFVISVAVHIGPPFPSVSKNLEFLASFFKYRFINFHTFLENLLYLFLEKYS